MGHFSAKISSNPGSLLSDNQQLSALLWSTGTETLGVMVFFLQYEGNSPSAAALATLVVAFSLGLALVADLIGRRFAPGVVPWQVG